MHGEVGPRLGNAGGGRTKLRTCRKRRERVEEIQEGVGPSV